jgi:hypothetical protein
MNARIIFGRHPMSAARTAQDFGWGDALERHDGACAGVLGDLACSGVLLHDDAALEHLRQIFIEFISVVHNGITPLVLNSSTVCFIIGKN